MRIIPINYIDTCSLSQSNGNSKYPADNLKSYIRKKVSRSSDNSSPYTIQAIFPKVRTISAVVLGRHNLYVGDTVNIKLYNAIFSDLAYTSGDIVINEDTVGSAALTWGAAPGGTFGNWRDNIWGSDIINNGVSITANLVHWVPDINLNDIRNIKSMTIEIVTPEQFVEVGRLIAGDYIEPTYNISYGHTMSWKEKVRQYRNEGNTLRSDDSAPYRQLTFDLKTINSEDNKKIQETFRSIGKRRDIFISLFPFDESITKVKDYSGIFKVTKTPKISEFLHRYYKTKFILEEV